MKKHRISNKINLEAKALAEANQIKYVIFKEKNTLEFDYCSLAEWNLVFEYLPNYQRIKTVVPTEKTDYNNVVISAQQILERHSDLFEGFDIIEFKPNQFTYKLIRK